MKQIFQEYFNPFQDEKIFLDQNKDFTTKLKEAQQIQKKEQRKEIRTFGSFAVIFAIVAVLLVLQMFSIVAYSDFSFLIWIALISAISYTIKRIQNNPIASIDKELERSWKKVYARTNQTSVTYNIPYKSKVILGVAARLAEKLGINPSVVRIALIALLFIPFLGGGIFMAYLILGIIQNRKENLLN